MGSKRKGKVDPLGLTSELKVCPVPIEGERVLGSGGLNRHFVFLRKQAFLDRALWGPVDELEHSCTVGHSRHDRHDPAGFNAR